MPDQARPEPGGLAGSTRLRRRKTDRSRSVVSLSLSTSDLISSRCNLRVFSRVLIMPAPVRIQVNDIDGIKVVRFNDQQLFDERTVREVAEQIAISLPSDGTPIRLVLDFSEVSLISSTALSKLILIQRRIDATRGKLRLCELSPILQQVFRTSNLDRLFAIDRDLRTSLEAIK